MPVLTVTAAVIIGSATAARMLAAVMPTSTEEDAMAESVGFIGLGTMGLPMVANLARAGQHVVAQDASSRAAEAARAIAGVSVVDSPREVAGRCRVVFTCLPDDTVVRAVYVGPGGIAEGGRPGLITCDCSTVSPELTVELHGRLAPVGISHMDTPMLGSQPQAVSGEIFFIVGGEGANLGVVAPYLTIMGRLHMHVGPVGSGNRVKLIHNGLAAVVSVAVGEALAISVKAGVDPLVLYDVVCKGGGMAFGTYWERRAKRICEGDFSPTFTLQHMRKDAGLAVGHARAAGVPTPLLDETLRTYDEALGAGWGAQDFSAVTHVIEQRIGRSIGRR